MLIDPTFFNPSLDGIIEWSYNCNSSDQGELMSVWTYDSIINNTITDIHCSNQIDSTERIVFEFSFDESSCGCVWQDPDFTEYDEV